MNIVNKIDNEKLKSIQQVSISELHKRLGFSYPATYPQSLLKKRLSELKMEEDDVHILRYIYRNFRPYRHLEFGTWEGAGTLFCLEECDATVWTINLPFGESNAEGNRVYGSDSPYAASYRAWSDRLGMAPGAAVTDSIGFTGRLYIEKGLGRRVCQIYCDSRMWDTSNYPAGFFDSALIDGGHEKEIVVNDTLKVMKLVRPGGIIFWHDFCPPVSNEFPSVQGVLDAISELHEWLISKTEKLFWIYPSWILLGVKKKKPNEISAAAIYDARSETKAGSIFDLIKSEDSQPTRERLGELLGEEEPISKEEYDEASRSIIAILRAVDIAKEIVSQRGSFSSVVLPLVRIRLERAREFGNLIDVERLEYAFEIMKESEVTHINEHFIAQAYWNHRFVLAKRHPNILKLSEAVGDANMLLLYQWAQVTSFILEFRPDMILELGRWKGRSTCALNDAVDLLASRRCKVVSICSSGDWNNLTKKRIVPLVPLDWFHRLEASENRISQFNYEAAVANAKRILVVWNDSKIATAECVLGTILPLIKDRQHAVIVYGISDGRYQVPSNIYELPDYSGNRDSITRLGDVEAARKDAVIIVDFLSRNGLTLFSADHGLHTGLKEKGPEMLKLLGDELFSMQAHWRWFTLNEREGQYCFPSSK